MEGKIPSAEEICKKQLYKVMDQIVKADVNEEEIEPFMADINRYFEYIDKEDIIKKIVSMEFGKFLAYYADAPEILPPSASGRGERSDRRGRGEGRKKEPHKAEPGYQKLFINLGKKDGFYPGEIMQFLNRNMKNRQEVGHIDLLERFCYIEVPEKDAMKVMRAIDGTTYKGRDVRCNDAEDTGKPSRRSTKDGKGGYDRQGRKGTERSSRRSRKFDETDDFSKFEKKSKRKNATAKNGENGGFSDNGNETDWRQFFRNDNIKLKGDEPDFSEEGWARRKPKKK